MVLKPTPSFLRSRGKFENDVEMYGAQTKKISNLIKRMFENDVEMYGAQTKLSNESIIVLFENDVEMYGAQTVLSLFHLHS